MLNCFDKAIFYLMVTTLAVTACRGPQALEAGELQATAARVAETMVAETAAAMPTPTSPPPSETALPTETATITPTPTITLTPTITPIPPTDTAIPGTMVMYFVALDTGGPVACGDSLVAVSVGVLPSGDVAADLKTVLGRLFGTKVMWVGGLYNPLYASTLQVDGVEYSVGPDDVVVYTSGTLVKGEDSCDWARLRDQVNTTARKVPGVGRVEIKLNGRPFNDYVSKDRPPQ